MCSINVSLLLARQRGREARLGQARHGALGCVGPGAVSVTGWPILSGLRRWCASGSTFSVNKDLSVLQIRYRYVFAAGRRRAGWAGGERCVWTDTSWPDLSCACFVVPRHISFTILVGYQVLRRYLSGWWRLCYVQYAPFVYL